MSLARSDPGSTEGRGEGTNEGGTQIISEGEGHPPRGTRRTRGAPGEHPSAREVQGGVDRVGRGGAEGPGGERIALRLRVPLPEFDVVHPANDR